MKWKREGNMIKITNLKPKDDFVKDSVKALINADMLSKELSQEVDKIPFNKLMMIFNLLRSVIIRGIEINNSTIEDLKKNGFKQNYEGLWYHEYIGTIQIKSI